MAVSVCPVDRVQAPVEVVCELLMHPTGITEKPSQLLDTRDKELL